MATDKVVYDRLEDLITRADGSNVNIERIAADVASVLGVQALDNISQVKSGSVQCKANGFSTIASVSGKGLFFGCASSGMYSQARVTVDGVQIAHVSGDSAGIVTPQYKALTNKSDRWGISDDENTVKCSPLPIMFESSLKIEAGSTSSSYGTTFEYLYVLL